MVNVIVLFPKIEEAKGIKNLLIRNGIEVTAVCTTGAQVIVAADDLEDGLVICGYKFVDMIYSELREYLDSSIDMLLVASKNHYGECISNDIVCLSMPIKSYDLINTVGMMVQTIQRKRKKRKEKPKVRTEEEKAVISNAKLMLISNKGMSEEEAHRYIQRRSMDTGTSLVETAQMILNIF